MRNSKSREGDSMIKGFLIADCPMMHLPNYLFRHSRLVAAQCFQAIEAVHGQRKQCGSQSQAEGGKEKALECRSS